MDKRPLSNQSTPTKKLKKDDQPEVIEDADDASTSRSSQLKHQEASRQRKKLSKRRRYSTRTPQTVRKPEVSSDAPESSETDEQIPRPTTQQASSADIPETQEHPQEIRKPIERSVEAKDDPQPISLSEESSEVPENSESDDQISTPPDQQSIDPDIPEIQENPQEISKPIECLVESKEDSQPSAGMREESSGVPENSESDDQISELSDQQASGPNTPEKHVNPQEINSPIESSDGDDSQSSAETTSYRVVECVSNENNMSTTKTIVLSWHGKRTKEGKPRDVNEWITTLVTDIVDTLAIEGDIANTDAQQEERDPNIVSIPPEDPLQGEASSSTIGEHANPADSEMEFQETERRQSDTSFDQSTTMDQTSPRESTPDSIPDDLRTTADDHVSSALIRRSRTPVLLRTSCVGVQQPIQTSDLKPSSKITVAEITNYLAQSTLYSPDHDIIPGRFRDRQSGEDTTAQAGPSQRQEPAGDPRDRHSRVIRVNTLVLATLRKHTFFIVDVKDESKMSILTILDQNQRLPETRQEERAKVRELLRTHLEGAPDQSTGNIRYGPSLSEHQCTVFQNLSANELHILNQFLEKKEAILTYVCFKHQQRQVFDALKKLIDEGWFKQEAQDIPTMASTDDDADLQQEAREPKVKVEIPESDNENKPLSLSRIDQSTTMAQTGPWESRHAPIAYDLKAIKEEYDDSALITPRPARPSTSYEGMQVRRRLPQTSVSRLTSEITVDAVNRFFEESTLHSTADQPSTHRYSYYDYDSMDLTQAFEQLSISEKTSEHAQDNQCDEDTTAEAAPPEIPEQLPARKPHNPQHENLEEIFRSLHLGILPGSNPNDPFQQVISGILNLPSGSFKRKMLDALLQWLNDNNPDATSVRTTTEHPHRPDSIIIKTEPSEESAHGQPNLSLEPRYQEQEQPRSRTCQSSSQELAPITEREVVTPEKSAHAQRGTSSQEPGQIISPPSGDPACPSKKHQKHFKKSYIDAAIASGSLEPPSASSMTTREPSHPESNQYKTSDTSPGQFKAKKQLDESKPSTSQVSIKMQDNTTSIAEKPITPVRAEEPVSRGEAHRVDKFHEHIRPSPASGQKVPYRSKSGPSLHRRSASRSHQRNVFREVPSTFPQKRVGSPPESPSDDLSPPQKRFIQHGHLCKQKNVDQTKSGGSSGKEPVVKVDASTQEPQPGPSNIRRRELFKPAPKPIKPSTERSHLSPWEKKDPQKPARSSEGSPHQPQAGMSATIRGEPQPGSSQQSVPAMRRTEERESSRHVKGLHDFSIPNQLDEGYYTFHPGRRIGSNPYQGHMYGSRSRGSRRTRRFRAGGRDRGGRGDADGQRGRGDCGDQRGG